MTLTKAEIVESLFEKVGLNKSEAKNMVESFFEEISTRLDSVVTRLPPIGQYSECAQQQGMKQCILHNGWRFPSSV